MSEFSIHYIERRGGGERWVRVLLFSAFNYRVLEKKNMWVANKERVRCSHKRIFFLKNQGDI